MVNPIGSGGTHPVAAALYGKKGEPESVRTSGQHYDQVQFSSHLSETEKRIKETSGQLVQQIRTRPPGRSWMPCVSRSPTGPIRRTPGRSPPACC